MSQEAMLARYRSYLTACNERDWLRLVQHLAVIVSVNGVERSQREYIGDIEATLAAFPDYHWELVRAVVDGEWLAVHLSDKGTRMGPFLGRPADGSVVDTDEFVMYRWRDDVIVEVEGTADNERLCRQTVESPDG